jgi:hypothetical protein
VRFVKRHGKIIGAGLVAVLLVGVVAFKLVGDSEPSRPAYSDVIAGYPMPDASAATLIADFQLTSPAIPYTYAGSTAGDDGNPLLWLDLKAPCEEIADYAAANHLGRVDFSFLSDGAALTSAEGSGWKLDLNAPMFGRDGEIHGGSIKIEMIVAGSDAKCQGYLAASYT